MRIFLRMFLRVEKSLTVNNVELHMHSLLIKEGLDQGNKLLQSFPSCQC